MNTRRIGSLRQAVCVDTNASLEELEQIQM